MAEQESIISENSRSDVRAKKAFANHLSAMGYENVRLATRPADIIAEKNGQDWYFEIKSTKGIKYFGAATETEWSQALKTPDRYRFVVVRLIKDAIKFHMFTPDEFMRFSTIPPFKVYFNIDLEKLEIEWDPISDSDFNKRKTCKREENTIKMDKETFQGLHGLFNEIRRHKSSIDNVD